MNRHSQHCEYIKFCAKPDLIGGIVQAHYFMSAIVNTPFGYYTIATSKVTLDPASLDDLKELESVYIESKKEMIDIFEINHIDYSAAVFTTNLTKINSNNMEDL